MNSQIKNYIKEKISPRKNPGDLLLGGRQNLPPSVYYYFFSFL